MKIKDLDTHLDDIVNSCSSLPGSSVPSLEEEVFRCMIYHAAKRLPNNGFGGWEIEGTMSRKVFVFSHEETMWRQKSNLRIHIVRSLQTQPLQTRIQLSFKTWMQEEQSSKAYLCCCLCAD